MHEPARSITAGTVPSLLRGNAGIAAWLLGTVLAGWGLLLWSTLDTSGGAARLVMTAGAAWTPASALAVLAMWAVMMAAMMLPGAAPMVLLFAALARRGRAPRRRVAAFVGAYLGVWGALSVGAALAQWTLQASGLVSPMLASTSPWLSGGLLIAAGAFQLTGLKRACLSRCRSPLGFLLTEWRDGVAGAWVMGVRHGVYCAGCCFALMALLFVAGVMNLAWVAALSGIVAVEKLAPRGDLVAKTLGAGLVVLGAVLVAAAP